MTDKLWMILELISAYRERPKDVTGFVEEALAVGPLPVPQVTWALLGLLHHRERKCWAWGVLHERLRPLLDRPEKDTVSIQDVLEGVQEGVVPGLPDWRYSLDGNDSHLIHRGTGEDIHFDALNGPELIPEGWFIRHFVHHRDQGPAEERLARLFPGGDGCPIALHLLRKTCLLRPTMEGEFTLCRKVTPYAGAVEQFLARWQDPADRPWLAALIGDWPAAHEAALAVGDGALAALAAPRAEECRRRWRKRLRKLAARVGLSDDLLKAIAHAGGDDVSAYMEQALADPGTLCTATKVLQDDPQWCERVCKLLLGNQQETSAPYTEVACARYLGRHAYRVQEVIQHLLSRERPDWQMLIELALAHAPEQLPVILPKALRSSSQDRLEASAILALLDTPWSRAVLIDRLDSTKSQDRTFECRAALRECRGAQAGDAVCLWENRHPEKTAAKPIDDRFLYKFAGGIRNVLLDRMLKLASSVQAVRDRLPQG